MGRFFTGVVITAGVIGSLAGVPFCLAGVRQNQNLGEQSVSIVAAVSAAAPVSTVTPPGASLFALPSAPAGRSTVMGGAIREVDPVRDQFMLHVYGGSSIKILFDERTHVYSNGTRIPLLHLGSADHVSVETVLDGDHIFARSIHILSNSPEGETQGQVLKFNPHTGRLTLQASIARVPLVLRVPSGTPVTRKGQAMSGTGIQTSSLADLVRGSMVAVQFTSDDHGSGVVRNIAILAQPGSSFVFAGEVSFLDLHAQRLDLVDPRDNQSYEISFDPSGFPASQKFHVGMFLLVTATFDGTRYTATTIREK